MLQAVLGVSAGVLVVGAAIRGVYVMARDEYFDAQRDYEAGYQKRGVDYELQYTTNDIDPELGRTEPYEEYKECDDQHKYENARPESPQPSIPSTTTPALCDTHSVVRVPPPSRSPKSSCSFHKFPPPPPRSPRNSSSSSNVTNNYNQDTITVAEPLNCNDPLPSPAASPPQYVDYILHAPEAEWASQRSNLSKSVIVHPPAHPPEHVKD